MFRSKSIAKTNIEKLVEGQQFLSFRPSDKLSYIAKIMHANKCRTACIVNAAGHLVGLLSASDILHYMMENKKDEILETTRAKEVMSANPVCLQAGTDLERAMQKLSVHAFQFMPIVDNNVPLGIIGLREIFVYTQSHVEKEMDVKNALLSYFMGNEQYGYSNI